MAVNQLKDVDVNTFVSKASVNQPEPAPGRRVLVVDDSRVQRKILNASLKRWGYLVDEAASGTEALSQLKHTNYDFVLSDWVMPEMNGLDLCKAFRDLPREGYGYFILLTANGEKDQVAQGLEVGADDFLSKPVHATELHARMRAGERILMMEQELVDKNRLVSKTLEEMSVLYAALDRDLIEARKLQMTLVRDRERDFGNAAVSVMLRPSGHVGGDLVGFFPISKDELAFYAVDVSGHGVTSAMLAARLAGMFSSSMPDGNIALDGAASAIRPPEEVAHRMNENVLTSMEIDQYFTCVYAVANLNTGAVSMVQAGHPHPMILRSSGAIECIGEGGLPVGLVPGATYDRIDTQLAPGDRILLVSDGFTEAANAKGDELGEDGMERFIRKNKNMSGSALLEALVWDTQAYVGDQEMNDDISAVLFEYKAL